MSEREPNHFETAQEKIPTPEEVYSVFKELTKSALKETRRDEDEKGLYYLEVATIDDANGEMTEYNYMRKGRFKKDESSATEIHATYYKDGEPISGTTVAKYIDGKWKIIL